MKQAFVVMQRLSLITILSTLALVSAASRSMPAVESAQLQPYESNPRYWQYQGQPTLLLGGSVEDNLFQVSDLEDQLDLIESVGGNVIRNTMSDRDEGDARAFARLEDGRYDLSRWNDEYWDRFEAMLEGTARRGIMVQIEVWDRFDHSRDQWKTDPYNPANNVNYSFESSGFAPEYPAHPLRNEQPLFFTVPELGNNEVVLPYQQAFVGKLLSHSLRYDHVLYCIDNETTTAEEWGAYWAAFIREEAASQGKAVFLTQMWDNWNVTADIHRRTTDRPDRYDYIDLSQNSWRLGQTNWENARVIWKRIAANPRPINSTKIYGSDSYGGAKERGTDTDHAIATFWRNLVGGFASSRFHRPDHGINLEPPAQTQIKAARSLQERYDFFRSVPDNDYALLRDRAEDEAYAASVAGEAIIVFFPTAGAVDVLAADVFEGDPGLQLEWLSLNSGQWQPSSATGKGASPVALETPAGDGPWMALIRPARD